MKITNVGPKQEVNIAPDEIRKPGWYRKGWTADPGNASFTSEWGIVSMSMMGWLGLVKRGDVYQRLWPKHTISAAMREVEKYAKTKT